MSGNRKGFLLNEKCDCFSVEHIICLSAALNIFSQVKDPVKHLWVAALLAKFSFRVVRNVNKAGAGSHGLQQYKTTSRKKFTPLEFSEPDNIHVSM